LGGLLAHRQVRKPSVTLLRYASAWSAEKQAEVILARLASLQAALEQGNIVVLDGRRDHARTRPLPIERNHREGKSDE